MARNKHMNILLIGSLPPPYGGISVHIQRLYEYIVNKGDRCKILHNGLNKLKLTNSNDRITFTEIKKLLKIKKMNPIVHFHVSALSNLSKIYLLSQFFYSQNKLITIHSGTFTKKIKEQSKLRRFFLRIVLKYFNYIIAVNTEQEMLLIDKLNIVNDNVIVIPAFIYPTASKKDTNCTEISLVEKSNKIKIVMSGYLQDFYGYDLVIDYLENHKKYLGYFVFYGTNNEEYKNRIIGRIKDMNNAYHFNDLTPQQFNWILKKANIYVRNTDRDGDCVAIREAAYWGVKVCASSSVTRPKGAELFSFNNKLEFENAVWNITNQPNLGKILPGANYASNIYKVYKSLHK